MLVFISNYLFILIQKLTVLTEIEVIQSCHWYLVIIKEPTISIMLDATVLVLLVDFFYIIEIFACVRLTDKFFLYMKWIFSGFAVTSQIFFSVFACSYCNVEVSANDFSIYMSFILKLWAPEISRCSVKVLKPVYLLWSLNF